MNVRSFQLLQGHYQPVTYKTSVQLSSCGKNRLQAFFQSWAATKALSSLLVAATTSTTWLRDQTGELHIGTYATILLNAFFIKQGYIHGLGKWFPTDNKKALWHFPGHFTGTYHSFLKNVTGPTDNKKVLWHFPEHFTGTYYSFLKKVTGKFNPSKYFKVQDNNRRCRKKHMVDTHATQAGSPRPSSMSPGSQSVGGTAENLVDTNGWSFK